MNEDKPRKTKKQPTRQPSDAERSVSFESKPDYIKAAIDAYACYASPSMVFKYLRDQYSDDSAPSLATVKTYRDKYRRLIIIRRDELKYEIPILDPKQRIAYAQELMDIAREGQETITHGGASYIKYDLNAGVATLKLVHEMTGGKLKDGDEPVNDDDIIRQIVQEAFDSMVEKNPEKTIADICTELISSLPAAAQPYIEELNSVQ